MLKDDMLIRQIRQFTEGLLRAAMKRKKQEFAEALLTVDNRDLLLRPGMTATARIVTHELDDVLLVPNGALRFAPPGFEAAEAGDRRVFSLEAGEPVAVPVDGVAVAVVDAVSVELRVGVALVTVAEPVIENVADMVSEDNVGVVVGVAESEVRVNVGLTEMEDKVSDSVQLKVSEMVKVLNVKESVTVRDKVGVSVRV